MSSRKQGFIYLILTMITFGSLYVAGKYVLEVVPSFTLLFLRYFIALAVLLFIYRKRPRPAIKKEDYKYVFIVGFVGYFLSIGFQFLGNFYCTASMASLITSMNPTIMILLAGIMLRERITLYKGVAVAFALLGTVIIIGDLGTGNQPIGVFFSFLSMIGWSYTAIIIRIFGQKYDAVTLTLYSMGIGMLFSLPASIIELQFMPVQLAAVTPSIVIWILYIGIVCTAGGLLFWNQALERLDATTCSLFYPLQPLTSTVLGMLFLREVLNINFILGGLLILTAILYAMIMDKRAELRTKADFSKPLT